MDLAFIDRQGLGIRKREGSHSRQQEAEISGCVWKQSDSVQLD